MSEEDGLKWVNLCCLATAALFYAEALFPNKFSSFLVAIETSNDQIFALIGLEMHAIYCLVAGVNIAV